LKSIVAFLRPLIEKYPRVALIYRLLRDSKVIIQQPKMTSLGFKFHGNIAMEQGSFEPHETELVKIIFPKVDILINVGANIGYYTCLALYNQKKIIAFEPIELNVKVLLKNIKANNWQSNAEVLPIALSNSVGIIEIYGGGTGASLVKGWAGTSENYSTLVSCSTLNNILGNRLVGQKIFVIVDIEGAEDRMLEGSSAMLDLNPKPIWLVEISVEEHQPDGTKINPNLLNTFEKFWSRGYESITADSLLRKITREEIIKIIETKNNTFGTHNFLFFETDNNPLIS
jgi:FkbM family methyltransferase